MLSTLQAISWVYWLIGTIGLVGAGLLIWLAPAALLRAVPILTKFFLGTRPGVAILAGCLCWFVADVNRSKIDASDYAAKTAAFEQAQADRDVRIANTTRDQVRNEIAAELPIAAETDQNVKEFHDALPPIPVADASCRKLGADAATRLRIIAGEAVSRPRASAKGVPKARKPGLGVILRRQVGLRGPVSRDAGSPQQGAPR